MAETAKQLGDYVTLQRGTTYKSKLLEQPGPVLLGLASIERNGGFRAAKLKTYGGDSPEKLLVYPGELFASLKDVTQSADLLGSVARMPKDISVGRLTQDTVKLEFKDKDAPLAFIYWILRTPDYRAYCRSNATGTTNLGLSRDDFLSYPIPPLTARRQAIVEILESVESRLAVNRKMNQTLEAIARALFKSWFVDFDPVRKKQAGQPTGLPPEIDALFPGEFEDSALGAVPKGWRVGNIYEEALYINGAAFRDADFSKSPSALPVIKIAELKSGVTDSTKFTEQNKGDKYYIDSGDLLFSWSGNPDTSIDVFVWQAGKAVLNQHIFRVVPADGTPKSYLYYKLKSMMPIFTELARNKQTTGLGHVTVQNLRDQKVAIPDLPMLASSGAVLSHYFDRSLHLQREIQSLSKIRDTLLPRLISGELRVKDAERFGGA